MREFILLFQLSAVSTSDVNVMDNTKLIDSLLSKDPAVYPLVGTSYIMMRNSPVSGYPCETAAELLRYYRWLNRDSNARKGMHEQFHAVQIPNTTYDGIIKALSFKLRCSGGKYNNASTWDVMLQVLYNEVNLNIAKILGLYVLLPLAILCVMCYIIQRLFLYFSLKYRVRKGRFQIRSKNITFIVTSKERYKEMLKMRPYLDNHDMKGAFCTGEYGFCVVLLRPVYLSFNSATQEVKSELIHMQEWKTHHNLAKFLGVTEIRQDRYIVSELSRYL